MMTKLEQAARALLAHWDTPAWKYLKPTGDLMADLREALDRSGEANEMVVGWDSVKPDAIASDPLYQQGFVDGVEEGRNQVAEQAEQEPVAWMEDSIEFYASDRPSNTFTIPLYATTVRTKDLTDDEITSLWASDGFYRTPTDFARAVIAADRENNK